MEATSIASLEGMALGTPVVASGIGGLRDMISHGENGILYEAGNPQRLAEALRLLEDEALREHIAQGGMSYVREVWSLERWGEAILREYARTMEGLR